MTGRAANRVSDEHSGLVVPPRRKSQTMLLLADEYHLGFSRDGFFFSRPPPIPNPGSRAQLNVPPPPGPKLCRPCLTKCDSCATGPGPYRTPFIPQNEAAEGGWSFGNVQTVAGGFVVDESTLRFFFSAREKLHGAHDGACCPTAGLVRVPDINDPSSSLSVAPKVIRLIAVALGAQAACISGHSLHQQV